MQTELRDRALHTCFAAARWSLPLVLLLALLVAAVPASAAERQVSVRYGPIRLGPYQVGRGDQVFNVPKPNIDGFITSMHARLVYSNGREVPIANTMLHHVVFADLGSYIGEHKDATCDRFRMFDSRSFLPLHGHRFYGLGEERARLDLPPGYGYPTRAADRWAMTYMLMNHLPRPETVNIEYTMSIETDRQLQPVTPVWLDVRDCNLDPVFNVPGGRKRGSTYKTSTTWRAPTSGKLVFGLGHVHGGGKALRLSRPDCGDQRLFTSRPVWGLPSHPYYQVRPLLHEPGPISMTTFQSPQGIPVAAGERLKLTALYDAERPHVRVMGIMVVAFVPDANVTQRCAPLPSDVRTYWTQTHGRRRMPRITVPISGWRAGAARARAISRPPGARVSLRGDGAIDVAHTAFRPANVVLKRPARLRWRFFGDQLHNVTLANGPRGFSSDNLSDNREFAYRFRRRGTYRLFCTLHPLMTATVRVRGARRR
jgi:plastocyanin